MNTRGTGMLLPGCVKKTISLTIEAAVYEADPHFIFYANEADEIWWVHIQAFITCNSADSFSFKFTNVKADNGYISVSVYDAHALQRRFQSSSETDPVVAVVLTADITASADMVIIEGVVTANAEGNIGLEWKKDGDAGADMVVSLISSMVAIPLSRG